MRTRQPFEDVPLEFEDGSTGHMGGDVSADLIAQVHPDAVEKGIALPLGFMPHKGENRRTRRAAVANWVPPETTQKDAGAGGTPPAPDMPTRRELLKQRQRQRRGKLDTETRRLQRKATK